MWAKHIILPRATKGQGRTQTFWFCRKCCGFKRSMSTAPKATWSFTVCFFIDFYWLTRKSTHLQIWVSCDYLRAVSIETELLLWKFCMIVCYLWFICCFFFQFRLSCILIIMNNKEEINYELEHFRDVIYIDSSFKLKWNMCILMILIRASDSGIKHNVCGLKVPVPVGRGQGHPETFPRISSLPLDIGTFPGWLHAESHSLWIGPYAQPKSQHRCVAITDHAACCWE